MKVFINIKQLIQVRTHEKSVIKGLAMNELPVIDNAFLTVKEGKIETFGAMSEFDKHAFESYETIDATGRLLMPTWVDSHTHVVFADWRNREFEDRIQGLTYQEIAERGGGILNSASRMAEASESDLFISAKARIESLIRKGTGAIEIKSGYGLTTETELKMLRVIRHLKESIDIPIKATFLGAHAFPAQFKNNQEAYIDLLVDEMIPAVSAEGLADYIDAFCEKGYFSLEQTERVLSAGINTGMKAKVHVNQFNAFGAIELCTRLGAISVDHLEELSNEDIQALKTSQTIAVGLPGCSFFLGIPYTPVHDLMAQDIPVALATDFNPGSAPDGNMNFIFSLACIKMKMTPAQAVNAMTINAAAALELSDQVGSITAGKRANLMLTKPVNDLSFLPYSFADNHIEHVFVNGNIVQ